MHRKTDTGWSARFGAVDLKTIIALVFALAGLSWAVVAMMGARGEGGEADGPRVIASALDEDGNAVEADYTSTSGNKRLEAARTQIESIVSDESLAVLSAIQGAKGAPEDVSDAVTKSFLPLVSGDQDAFWDAIAAMGGKVPGEIDGEHPMFSRLKNEFEGAKIDLSRITVRRHESSEPDRGGGRMTREVDEQDGEEGGPGLQTQSMEMRPESIFPDAPGVDDPSAIEVRIPVQPKGEDLESIFMLILTWNTDAGLWQPATYGVIKNRLVEED